MNFVSLYDHLKVSFKDMNVVFKQKGNKQVILMQFKTTPSDHQITQSYKHVESSVRSLVREASIRIHHTEQWQRRWIMFSIALNENYHGDKVLTTFPGVENNPPKVGEHLSR